MRCAGHLLKQFEKSSEDRCVAKERWKSEPCKRVFPKFGELVMLRSVAAGRRMREFVKMSSKSEGDRLPQGEWCRYFGGRCKVRDAQWRGPFRTDHSGQHCWLPVRANTTSSSKTLERGCSLSPRHVFVFSRKVEVRVSMIWFHADRSRDS